VSDETFGQRVIAGFLARDLRIAELERDLEIVQAHAERNEAAATRFQLSLAERDEEVAELERREALLTAVATACYGTPNGDYGIEDTVEWLEALNALTDAGFPWTEPAR
jgi:hypothetical protein